MVSFYSKSNLLLGFQGMFKLIIVTIKANRAILCSLYVSVFFFPPLKVPLLMTLFDPPTTVNHPQRKVKFYSLLEWKAFNGQFALIHSQYLLVSLRNYANLIDKLRECIYSSPDKHWLLFCSFVCSKKFCFLLSD